MTVNDHFVSRDLAVSEAGCAAAAMQLNVVRRPHESRACAWDGQYP